jgi:hypothetical protein
VLTASALLATGCGGGSGPAPRSSPASTSPSASPTSERVSRSTFLIYAGSVCLNLMTARDVLREYPTYKTHKDLAIGLRTMSDVIDSTHRTAVSLVPTAPEEMKAEYRRSVVNPLSRMTKIIRIALQDFRAGRMDALEADGKRLGAPVAVFTAYGAKYHLDQCRLL